MAPSKVARSPWSAPPRTWKPRWGPVRLAFRVSTPASQDLPFFFIERDELFRAQPAHRRPARDDLDNWSGSRFSAGLCGAIRHASIFGSTWSHANDWQTGLIPAFLKIEYRGGGPLRANRLLVTIHNVAYQGCSGLGHAAYGTGLEVLQLAAAGVLRQINLLKGRHCRVTDRINTVSWRYAKEIQSAPFGYGLEGVLQGRA